MKVYPGFSQKSMNKSHPHGGFLLPPMGRKKFPATTKRKAKKTPPAETGGRLAKK